MPQFKLQHAVSLLLTLALPLTGRAAIDVSLARTIYTESGTEQQLKQTARLFPKGVREGLAKNPAGRRFDPDTAERLAREAFDPAATREAVIETLREELAPAEAEGVLTWLRGELGKRITDLQIAAAGPETEAQMLRFAEALQKQLPPGSRLQLIQSLDKAIGLTETATQMTLSMTVAAGLGSLDTQAGVDEQALQHLRAEMEKERDFIQEAVAEQTFAHLLFAYRSLGDEDLRRYIDFARSTAGAAYTRVMSRGIDRAVSQATLRLAQALAQSGTSQTAG